MIELYKPIMPEQADNRAISEIQQRIDAIKDDTEKLQSYIDRAIKFIWPAEGEIIASEKIAQVVLEIIYKELEPNADLSELDAAKVSEFISIIDDIIVLSSKDDRQKELYTDKEPKPMPEISTSKA